MKNNQKVHFVATENSGFSVISLPPGITPWAGYRVCGGPYKSKAYAQRVAEKKNFQQDYPEFYAEALFAKRVFRRLTAEFLKEASHA